MNNNIVAVKWDKIRNVKLSNKAMKIIEKTLNSNISDILKRMGELNMDEMITIVYAGLVHEDKTLTIEQVEDLLDEYCSFGEMIKLIVEAFKVSIGTDVFEEVEKKNPNV